MVINYNYFQSVKGYDNIKFIMLKQFGALPPSQLVLIVALGGLQIALAICKTGVVKQSNSKFDLIVAPSLTEMATII
jgi:hypothetical protein